MSAQTEETIQATKPEINLNDAEFSRASVEALVEQGSVRLTDSSDGLDLFCNIGNAQEYHQAGKLERQCRGVVFCGEDTILKAFPFPYEYDTSEADLIKKIIKPVFSECSFYEAYEGALIRMFYYNGKWYTCTHRKLDAFKSQWSSQISFGEHFVAGLEAEVESNEVLCQSLPEPTNANETLLSRFQETLNTEKQYMFLIRNNADNRIVCAAPDKPTIYHVGTFSQGNLSMDDNINIQHPLKYKISEIEDVFEVVKKMKPQTNPGLIVFAPDNQQIKILNKEYRELFNVRGNQASVLFRYLQVRMDNTVLPKFLYLYEDTWNDQFQEYEDAIFQIAQMIFGHYRSRFMYRQQVTRPPEEWKVMQACHKWHLSDPAVNRVTPQKVYEFLNQQSPSNINHMIKRLKEETKEKETVVTKVQTRARSNTMTSPMITPQIGSAANILGSI